MNSHLVVWVLLIINTLQTVKSEDDCLYTFEDETEMEDFDPRCDGLKGNWKIMELPNGAPSSFGNKALTIEVQSNGCLKSSKQLTLNSTTKVLTKFYWKKPQHGSIIFQISFLTKNLLCRNNMNCQKDFTKSSCDNNAGCWDIAQKYDSVIGERWVEDEFNVFTLPGIQDYEMQINLYLNSATVMIDSITILDIISNSDQCYLNPKTTTTTTELTSTTTTEIITTTMDTSTVAETTTSTAETYTTSTEITTEEKSTTLSDGITTEASTLVSQTETGGDTTASDDTSEETSSVASTVSGGISVTFSTIQSDTTSIESDTSSTILIFSSTDSTKRENLSSSFIIFLAVFAVVISLVVVIFFCSFIIWFHRRRRTSKNPFKKQKTDHEYYDEVRKEWKTH